jgi:hypothetical protein
MHREQELLNQATLIQYQQRILERPYLSPEEMQSVLPGSARITFDALEIAELIFQIRHIGWEGYILHADRFTLHPERVYDFVKAHKSGLVERVYKTVADVSLDRAAAE